MKRNASTFLQSMIALKLAALVGAAALTGCASTGPLGTNGFSSDVSAEVIDIYHGA
jgi:hypothetical protein